MHLKGIAGNDSCFVTFDPVFVELRGYSGGGGHF